MAAFKKANDRRSVRYQASCPKGGTDVLSSYAVFDGISFWMSDIRSEASYLAARGPTWAVFASVAWSCATPRPPRSCARWRGCAMPARPSCS